MQDIPLSKKNYMKIFIKFHKRYPQYYRNSSREKQIEYYFKLDYDFSIQ